MTQLLPRFYADVERVRDARKIAEIVRDTGEVPADSRATAAGDSRKLRGIPCVARGVPGAAPGTSPHTRNW